MSEKERALNSLALALESSSAALSALGEAQSPVQSAQTVQPSLEVLHKDLITLFSLIYASVTKLAICLKPTSPTYSACHSPLQDLSRNLIAVATNVAFFDEAIHGQALVREVQLTAREIVEAARGLLQSLITTVHAPSAVEDGGDYLIRTGTVHELIETARGASGGLSRDNLDAVRKKWAADKAVMDDAMKELDEMLVDADANDGKEEEEEEFDDGWDELGLRGTQKMTDAECRRAKGIQPLLRFVTLLHKRVLVDLLARPRSPSVQTLDSVVGFSSKLQAGVDELIATLYPTQQPSAISDAVRVLAQQSQSMQAQLEPLLSVVTANDVANHVAALNISVPSKPSSAAKSRDPAQWFPVCFAQIQKTAAGLHEEVAG